MTLHKRPVVKERTPNTPRVIYVAGGYLRSSLDILEGYNVDDRSWISLPKLTVPRSGLGGAFLKVIFSYKNVLIKVIIRKLFCRVLFMQLEVVTILLVHLMIQIGLTDTTL